MNVTLKKKKRNQHLIGEDRGRWVNSHLSPTPFPFSPQFMETPKSPQIVGLRRKHPGPTKSPTPLPNQTHKSPLFSPHFPSPQPNTHLV